MARTMALLPACTILAQGDLIEIEPNESPDKGKKPASEVFPFDKETIPVIDIAAGMIVFNPPIMIETPDE